MKPQQKLLMFAMLVTSVLLLISLNVYFFSEVSVPQSSQYYPAVTSYVQSPEITAPISSVNNSYVSEDTIIIKKTPARSHSSKSVKVNLIPNSIQANSSLPLVANAIVQDNPVRSYDVGSVTCAVLEDFENISDWNKECGSLGGECNVLKSYYQSSDSKIGDYSMTLSLSAYPGAGAWAGKIGKVFSQPVNLANYKYLTFYAKKGSSTYGTYSPSLAITLINSAGKSHIYGDYTHCGGIDIINTKWKKYYFDLPANFSDLSHIQIDLYSSGMGATSPADFLIDEMELVSAKTYEFRTAALDFDTEAFIPSTITVDGETKQGDTPPQYKAVFNVRSDALLETSYSADGYKSNTDEVYFDSRLDSLSTDCDHYCPIGFYNEDMCCLYSTNFKTACKWESEYSDYKCTVTSSRVLEEMTGIVLPWDFSSEFIYNPGENTIKRVNYLLKK